MYQEKYTQKQANSLLSGFIIEFHNPNYLSVHLYFKDEENSVKSDKKRKKYLTLFFHCKTIVSAQCQAKIFFFISA